MKFVQKQATPVQGCTGEAQMNMDVNLRRLPDKKEYNPKFLVPVAGSIYTFIEFPMSLTALPRIKIVRTEAGVLYIYNYHNAYGKMLPNSN